MSRRDPVTIVAGVVVAVLGLLTLAIDAVGLDLRPEYALAAVLAGAGVVLVVLGWSRDR